MSMFKDILKTTGTKVKSTAKESLGKIFTTGAAKLTQKYMGEDKSQTIPSESSGTETTTTSGINKLYLYIGLVVLIIIWIVIRARR